METLPAEAPPCAFSKVGAAGADVPGSAGTVGTRASGALALMGSFGLAFGLALALDFLLGDFFSYTDNPNRIQVRLE